ncbi:hypothetical protein OIU76_009323 [Salix suchowensis]|nr:hypothetical protein OIU76_009323 [Salix suchowensis]
MVRRESEPEIIISHKFDTIPKYLKQEWRTLLNTSLTSPNSTTVPSTPLSLLSLPLHHHLSPSSNLHFNIAILSPLVPNTTTLLRINSKPKGMLRVNCSTNKPLKVMISGALGSGKGTQCELIVKNGRKE